MDPLKTGMMICESRKAKNMTQKDLATKLFVSDKAVSKWERGLCFPDIYVLIPLTEVLGISLYDLLKGEKMNKKEVEETLRNTINYSNKEINKNKKKIVIISVVVILIILIISILLIFKAKNNEDNISAIVDRDTLYNISEYHKYKTSLSSKETEKIENILNKLSLSWMERTFDLQDDKITIIYNETFNEVARAYNDENYVKEAILNNITVLFTTVSDLETIKIKFNDYSYTVKKEDALKIYSISSFEEIADAKNWNSIVFNNLEKKEFVSNSFKNYLQKEK